VHPVAFQIGSLTIYWYGVMVAAAFLLGLWTAGRRGLRDGLPPEQMVDLGIWIIVAAIAGSRLFYVVAYWKEEFAGAPFWHVFYIRMGGLYFYGGLFGASAATALYTRIKRLPLGKVADAFAPSIALGHLLGRFGCFLNGCCYGAPTSLPWGVRFAESHPTHGERVHPAQLYESALNLVLYAALAWLHRHKRFDGQVFGAYLVLYGGTRFGLEFLRADYDAYYLGGWATAGHLTSIVILLAGVLWLWVAQRRRRPHGQS
jgi:phosphatidylglycerol:prolipoprotein diacylglycerol transferase